MATSLVLAVLWAVGPPPVDSLELRVQHFGLVGGLGLVDLIFGVNIFFSVSIVWLLLPVLEVPNVVALARVAPPSKNGDVEAVRDPDPVPDRGE